MIDVVFVVPIQIVVVSASRLRRLRRYISRDVLLVFIIPPSNSTFSQVLNTLWGLTGGCRS